MIAVKMLKTNGATILSMNFTFITVNSEIMSAIIINESMVIKKLNINDLNCVTPIATFVCVRTQITEQPFHLF